MPDTRGRSAGGPNPYRKVVTGEPDAVKAARPVREGKADILRNEGVGPLLHSLGSGFDSLAAHQ